MPMLLIGRSYLFHQKPLSSIMLIVTPSPLRPSAKRPRGTRGLSEDEPLQDDDRTKRSEQVDASSVVTTQRLEIDLGMVCLANDGIQQLNAHAIYRRELSILTRKDS